MGVDRRRAKPVPGSLGLASRRCARERVRIRTRVCVPHRGGSPYDELPRSFIGLPVIMIMPRGARGPPKSRKGRGAHLLPCFAPRCHSAVNFLLTRDKNTLSIENGGWWSHRYVSVDREKKSFASEAERHCRSKHEYETVIIRSVSKIFLPFSHQ